MKHLQNSLWVQLHLRDAKGILFSQVIQRPTSAQQEGKLKSVKFPGIPSPFLPPYFARAGRGCSPNLLSMQVNTRWVAGGSNTDAVSTASISPLTAHPRDSDLLTAGPVPASRGGLDLDDVILPDGQQQLCRRPVRAQHPHVLLAAGPIENLTCETNTGHVELAPQDSLRTLVTASLYTLPDLSPPTAPPPGLRPGNAGPLGSHQVLQVKGWRGCGWGGDGQKRHP